VNGVDPWQLLTQPGGLIEYLEIMPGSIDNATGTFRWTTNLAMANESARIHFVRFARRDNFRVSFATIAWF
jgi:hypothetical protein